MQLEYIISNRLTPAVFIPEVIKQWQTYYKYDAFKQYYTQFHDVTDLSKRPLKEIYLPDRDGKLIPGTLEVITHLTFVEVNRIVLGLQKMIVSRKTAFTTGGNVNIHAKPATDTERNLYEAVLNTWSDNKMQFRNADIFRALISETEACEIWYSHKDEAGNVSMKCNIYSPSKGYELIPVYDNNRDLVGFGLKYEISEDINGVRTAVKQMKFYDKEFITVYRDDGNGWNVQESQIAHKYGKIPVIYYQVEQSAWQDGQSMIDRLEELLSNFGDTNDYNGSPILVASGTIQGFMAKGERGKVMQLNGGADLKYVSWDQAPESIKLEIETLLKLLFMTLQVPDISFDSIKGMGGLSGVAFDRLLIDAHLNATDYHNGVYGEGIQRRLNFLKAAVAAIEPSLREAVKLSITPQFSLFSINSDSERIDTAMKANGGLAVMSQKESIKYAGVSDDAEETLNEIQGQGNAEVTE